MTDKAIEFGADDSISLHYSTPMLEAMETTSSSSSAVGRGGESEADPDKSFGLDPSSSSAHSQSQCPHRAVMELPRVTEAEQDRDKLKLASMRAHLG